MAAILSMGRWVNINGSQLIFVSKRGSRWQFTQWYCYEMGAKRSKLGRQMVSICKCMMMTDVNTQFRKYGGMKDFCLLLKVCAWDQGMYELKLFNNCFFFFQNVILCSYYDIYKFNNFLQNRSNTMNNWSALWKLMAWYLCSRTWVTTVLSMHPHVFSSFRANKNVYASTLSLQWKLLIFETSNYFIISPLCCVLPPVIAQYQLPKSTN